MKIYGRGFVYIYNPEQKDFYVEEGQIMVNSDKNPSTNKQFWVYKYDEVQVSFDKWCKRSR